MTPNKLVPKSLCYKNRTIIGKHKFNQDLFSGAPKHACHQSDHKVPRNRPRRLTQHKWIAPYLLIFANKPSSCSSG